KYTPEVPTPGVNWQVLSAATLQPSRSMLSLAPPTNRFGCEGSTARAGSFCLSCVNKVSLLPTETSVSAPWVAAAGNGINTAARPIAAPSTTRRLNRMCTPSLGTRRVRSRSRSSTGRGYYPGHRRSTPNRRGSALGVSRSPASGRPGQAHCLGMDGDLVTPRGIVVPAQAITWRFSRGTGPGGQGVNTTDSRVERVVDLTALVASDAVADRVRERFRDALRIVAAAERPPLRHRQAALRRLAVRLD